MAKIDESVSHQELITLLNAMLADYTSIRTNLITLAAKLDDDATVTDTNYEATCTPAALTVTVS